MRRTEILLFVAAGAWVALAQPLYAQDTPQGDAPDTVNTEAPSEAPQEAPQEAPAEVAQPVQPAKKPPSYNMKLRNIEERVNELKEKIFQSKARLVQLQEVVLKGSITGARAVLIHRNEMGGSFRLWRVQYSLDGAPILNRVDSGGGELNDQNEIEVFNGSIAPGNHQVSVYLEYHGHGYGVFSYLKGYKFKIKSSYTFTAEEGKLTTLKVVGFEEGGITTQLKDRPTVRYDLKVTNDLAAKGPKHGAAQTESE